MITRELSNPDLSIGEADGGKFELWILDREFPQSKDYWDGNWLDVIARCSALGAEVSAEGPMVSLSELQQWLVELQQIDHSLSGEAHLNCIEPYLNLTIKMKSRGCCELDISITQEHLSQSHQFLFELDQSYLKPVIESLEAILKKYPIRGESSQ